ncbi:MAG: PQQ-binding-like beta-propeller repeat protein [Bacteroidetes bacterium]|nr:PQQ-binding-like beta-propeller repeat protein [Bacteroidota bacterium]MBU1680081.1 PQQ-binding-like beta-propeller repeat protein [Bacteroidota bacterium]MBU2507904.1 PQQ-binding-like beta-propeller repeat protein [Bacteroidota bacterium]
MRRAINTVIIFISLVIIGCSKSISLSSVKINQDGHFYLGQSESKPFIYDYDISDSIKLLWEAEVHGSFSNCSPVIYDEYIFAADLAGRLYVFDVNTGKEIGSEIFKGEIRATPVIRSSTIILQMNEFKSLSGKVIFFDFIRGKIKKEIEIEDNLTNDILPLEDEFILLTANGILRKYSFSGNEIWQSKQDELTYSNPVLAGNKILFTTVSGKLIAVDFETGKKIYSKNIGGSFRSGVYSDGIFITSGDMDGNLYRINCEDGIVIWKFSSGSEIRNISLITGKGILVSNLAGRIALLEENTGQIIWERKAKGVFNSTPILVGNTIIQPDLDMELLFLSIDDGTILNKLTFEKRLKTSPVIYRDKLFIGADRGLLYCYKFN